MIKLIISACFTFMATLGFSQNLRPNTTDQFTFIPPGPLSNQPVEVYYHIPDGDVTTMPILFSCHGARRNGDDYRDYWIEMADEGKFMVFAPEFSEANYPGLGDNYLMGNVFIDGDNPSLETLHDKDEWTFSVVESLFEFIKQETSSAQDSFKAWGHSGGAQFLHRFLLFMPESKLNIAVCSNAGWYTVPESGVSFPYGIQNSQLSEDNITQAFSRKLFIHLGLEDSDPNASNLRHNDVVDGQQGLHRLQRGRYFFNTSQLNAQTLGVPFNWEKYEVADIAHEAGRMAEDALQYLFPVILSNRNGNINSSIEIFPNPTSLGFIKLSEGFGYPLQLQVVDQLGKSVLIGEIESNLIGLPSLSFGIYILQLLTADGLVITKKFVVE